MRILFDKNVPVGVRRFLESHEVHTVVDLRWPPQLENGAMLDAAERDGFDLVITADQNIRYQQNLAGRRVALLVLGSNIWPIDRNYAGAIRESVARAVPGNFNFIEMPLPSGPPKAYPA